MNDDTIPDGGKAIGPGGAKARSHKWRICLLKAFALAAFCASADVGLAPWVVVDEDIYYPEYGSFGMILGPGVLSVTWQHSMGERSQTVVTSTGSFTETGLLCGTTVRIIAVQYANWHEPDGADWNGWYFVLNDVPFCIDIQARRTYRKTASDGTVVVASDARPADVGIRTGAFSAEGTPASALGKVLTWDSRFNGGGGTAVGEIEFAPDGAPVSDAAKAYLLNCAATPDSLRTAVSGFRITSFSPEHPPKSGDFAGKGYNGRVVIKGAAVLGDWHEVDEETGLITAGGGTLEPRFFRAELVR